MIEYAEEEDVCRSRMLLAYFSEANPQDCGHCDVCLRKTETGLTNYQFRVIAGQLKSTLQSDGPIRFNHLVDSVPEESRDDVILVLRYLIDENEFC